MVIVKLSKKFRVGKICNDRKRARLKGHVYSVLILPRCPVTFSPFLGFFSVSTCRSSVLLEVRGGGEGTKVSTTNYSSIVVSCDRKSV